MLIKTKNVKENFADNQFQNLLRLCDILPITSFTKNETMGDYYL